MRSLKIGEALGCSWYVDGTGFGNKDAEESYPAWMFTTVGPKGIKYKETKVVELKMVKETVPFKFKYGVGRKCTHVSFEANIFRVKLPDNLGTGTPDDIVAIRPTFPPEVSSSITHSYTRASDYPHTLHS